MSNIHRVAGYAAPPRAALPKAAELCEVFAKSFTARPEIVDPLDRAAYIFLTAVYNHVGFLSRGEDFQPALLPVPENWRTLANACKRYHHTAQVVLWLFPELETDRDRAEIAARRGRWRLLAALPRTVVIASEREALDAWVAAVRTDLTRPAPGLVAKLLRFRITGKGNSPSTTDAQGGAGEGGAKGPNGEAIGFEPLAERPTTESLLRRLDAETVAWFSQRSIEFGYNFKHGEWGDLAKLVRSGSFARLVLRPLDAVFANTSLTIADLARLLDPPENDASIVPAQLWLAGYSMALHSPRLTVDPTVRCRCMPTSISAIFPRAGFNDLFDMHMHFHDEHLYDLWAMWWQQKTTLEEEEQEQQRVKDTSKGKASAEARRLVEMERAPIIGIPRTALFSIYQLRNLCQLSDADDLMQYMRGWDDFCIVTKVLGLRLQPEVGKDGRPGPFEGDHSWAALGLTPTKLLMHPRLGYPVVLADEPTDEVVARVIAKLKAKLVKIGFKRRQVDLFCIDI